jgi:enamine deaminase RidA (YjgF/YER057c/UK114 family)
MTLELINPEDLPTPPTYTHVIVATGSKIVFIAGQEPEDAHGNLVGADDMAAQARQVFANLGRALAACDARPGRSPRSRSMWFATGLSICQRSTRPGKRCSAITSQPTQ